MVITKEQQEAMFNKYIKENKFNVDQFDGFIDGMNAAFKLVSQIEERNRKELTKQDNQ